MIEKYMALNGSFKKKLIFRFGDGAGFFSEFNNLVFAVLYCLDAGYRFSLYSPHDGTLAIRKGWDDYFLPFCEQVDEEFHKENNERFLMGKIAASTRIRRWLYKKKNDFDYYTYELWDRFRSDDFSGKLFDIRELGIRGDFLGSASLVADMLWRYEPSFGDMVRERIDALALPEPYVGLHIRGGDKVTESQLFEPEEYMELLKARSSARNVFVLTDDYRNIVKLRTDYPEYSFYTMCSEAEYGYDFSEFQKKGKGEQQGEYAKLLASVEILRRARISFGSYKTNPGMYLGMTMRDRFVGIDSDRWLLKW